MNKPQKTLEEVQLEYQKLALQLGHLVYQISALTNEKEQLLKGIQQVNLEAAEIKSKEEPKE